MGRLLAIWRSWSIRRRVITVLVAAVAVGGLGVLAYELLKRPPDVVNENVDFASKEQPKPKQKRPKDTTFDWPTYGFNDARTRYVPSDKVKPPFAPGTCSWPMARRSRARSRGRIGSVS